MSTGPHLNVFGLHQFDNMASFFGASATILPQVSTPKDLTSN